MALGDTDYLKGKPTTKHGEKKKNIGAQHLDLGMQKIEVQKLNLVKLWKKGVLGINPFSYSSLETLKEKKVHALSSYFGRVSNIREFPSRNPSPPNLNNIIFEHRPFDGKVYPLGATIWRSR